MKILIAILNNLHVCSKIVWIVKDKFISTGKSVFGVSRVFTILLSNPFFVRKCLILERFIR